MLPTLPPVLLAVPLSCFATLLFSHLFRSIANPSRPAARLPVWSSVAPARSLSFTGIVKIHTPCVKISTSRLHPPKKPAYCQAILGMVCGAEPVCPFRLLVAFSPVSNAFQKAGLTLFRPCLYAFHSFKKHASRGITPNPPTDRTHSGLLHCDYGQARPSNARNALCRASRQQWPLPFFPHSQ